VIAGFAAGVQQAVWGACVAGLFLLLGKGADWLIKRRAERRALTVDEREAEDDRLEGIADRFKELAVAERSRADQIAGERDTMERTLNAKIDALGQEIGRMKVTLAEKDALISEQAQKIAGLERRVRDLEKHERRAAQDIS
jgi:hypothetical protein